jgi:hypothetical protein
MGAVRGRGKLKREKRLALHARRSLNHVGSSDAPQHSAWLRASRERPGWFTGLFLARFPLQYRHNRGSTRPRPPPRLLEDIERLAS